MSDDGVRFNGSPQNSRARLDDSDAESGSSFRPLKDDEGPTCDDSVGPKTWEEAVERALDESLRVRPEDFDH